MDSIFAASIASVMKLFPSVFPTPLQSQLEEAAYIKSLSKKIAEHIGQGERLIGLYTDNNAFTYYSILASWDAGVGFVPLNHKFPENRIKTIVEDTGIKSVLCNAKSQDSLKAFGFKNIIANDDLALDETMEDGCIEIKMASSEIAYVLFTSGSTGIPKGIPITIGNVQAFTEDIVELLKLKATDKVLQTYELSFDLSIGSSLMAWASGARLYICPMNGIIPLDAVKMIMEHQVNIINMAPSTVNVLRKYRLIDELNLPYIEQTIFGGEAVPLQAVEDWSKCAPNAKIINAYGPTEATIWATYYTVDGNTSVNSRNGLIPIGKPAKNVQCYLHKDANISSQDNQGELWLGGEQIFYGYINNKEKNKAVLTEMDNTRYYRTGDLVELMENGDLIYLNRLDNQVKISGFRVEPGEVEFKIKQLLKIGSCAVMPIVDDDGTTWLLAILEKESFTTEEKKLLQDNIAYYMFPRKFVTVSQMPLNHSGKTDRQLLKKTYGI